MNILSYTIPSSIVYCYIFVIGMCLGSFFMVAGYRIPRKETLVGRSHCENCQHELAWWQLIPVVSYIFLRGKCKYCTSKIGAAAPVFELFTGTLFMGTAMQFNFSPEVLVGWLLISLLLIISVSDVLYQIIPNKVLLPFFIAAVLERIIIPQNQHWWYPAAGFLVGFIPLYILGEVSKKGMGGGDIKLFAVLGVFLGPVQVFASLFFAALIALIFALIWFAYKKERQKYIPFGPFIAISSVLVYLISAGIGR
ncbi:prepilin peptidase [Enterococcus sp. BWB1-3]|uniref:prepilin peptidase n=1 Tax=unclassified Enterococcus TaxID=2608891 RepID=UPI001924DEED|nr:MULTISPECIES: A24 family peptidase [unclassified Enterococcus]MBL1229150.1 prepilin peptidase [Enterococcus sp. BWB1-3]MCB5953428.1 prepilin peptidase [Enterococcus sp. CWB-B31]